MARQKYFDEIVAWAEGREVQFRAATGFGGPSAWVVYVSDGGTPPGFGKGLEWRIKPATVTINGIEVPAGETKLPARGKYYYVPMVDNGVAASCMCCCTDDEDDRRRLAAGLVHIAPEAAVQMAEAMLAFKKD